MTNTMFNFTPPRVANCHIGHSQHSCSVSGGAHPCARRLFLFLFLALAAALVFCAGYRKGVSSLVPQPLPEDGQPVPVKASLFFNRDSVMYYYEQGLLHDDPKGLFVIGVAAHLRQDGILPEEIYAPSVAEGDECLLLSANLGYRDAIQAIYCLHKHGNWPMELPSSSGSK